MLRLLKARWMQAAVAGFAMVLMLGASGPVASTARFNRLGHEMICTCGCGQILLECNHVGCPVSGPMIGELQDQMAVSGNTDTSVFHWFETKYGATVIAAPIRGGFDNVAWIIPIAVFLLGTVGTAVVVRVWKLRTVPGVQVRTAGPGNPAADALRERIRRETEY